MQVLKISNKLAFLKPTSKSYKICRFKSDSKLIVSLEKRKTLHLMEIPQVTIKDFNKEKMAGKNFGFQCFNNFQCIKIVISPQ